MFQVFLKGFHMRGNKTSVTPDDIRTALAKIADPVRGDIVSAQRVQELVVEQGKVSFLLDVTGIDPDTLGGSLEGLHQAAEQAASAVAGVVSVRCVMTTHRPFTQSEKSSTAAPPPNTANMRPPPNREIPEIFNRIGAVVAVASGKGGVGKSTIAVNLALALQQAGLKTGLLDADIYGPSIPQLLNITEKPELIESETEKNKLVPIDRFGVATMSIGFLVSPEQAMIWRGPMVQSALLQMLNDVVWPPLDILVIDMPPGTGDIQLTMAQRIPVSGALIVSTPSALALADVTRAIGMFEKTDIPVLGLVENMAYMTASDGSKTYPFGEGGAALAKKTGLPCLAALPLDAAAHEAAEQGKPIVTSNEGALPPLFTLLAKKVQSALEEKEKEKN